MALLYSSSSRWMAWMYGVLNAAAIAWIWYAYRPGRKSTLTIHADDIEFVLTRPIRFRFRHTAVVAVESATWRSAQDVVPDYLDTAYPLEPNVLVTLDRPVEVRFALGITKDYRRIAVRVEDAEGVLTALRQLIASVRTRS
jgi:acyl-CoA synthetase (AMP-forming)/AMP-acid ligase II